MSTINLTVADVSSLTPLIGATISINGNAAGQTDNRGTWSGSANDTDDLTISYVGYDPLSGKAAYLNGTTVGLSQAFDMLPAVVVKPQSGSKQAGINPIVPIALAIGVIALSKKNKRVGAAKKDNTGKYLALGLIAVGGVYLLTRKGYSATSPTNPTVKTPAGGGAGSGSGSGSLGPLVDLFKNLFGSGGSDGSGPDLNPVQPIGPAYGGGPAIGPIGPTGPLQPVDLGPLLNPADGGGGLYSGGGGGVDPIYDPEYSTDTESFAMAGIPLTPEVITLGVLTGFALLSKSKKESTVGDFDYTKLIVPGVVIGGAAFIMWKLGLFDKKPLAQDAAAKAEQDKIKTDLQQATQDHQPSYPDSNYYNWANDIYQQGMNSTVDEDAIVRDVIQANTLTDLLKLIQAFGNREASTSFWSSCNFMGINCPLFDLGAFLKQVLSSDNINKINSYLNDQQINYQF